MVREGLTNATIARELAKGYALRDGDKPLKFRPLEVTEASIRRFRKRHGVNPDGISAAYTRVNDNTAEAATESIPIDGETDPKIILTDPDTMLRQRGLDPEDWVITHMTPNMYEGPNSKAGRAGGGPAKLTYYQTKFTCQRVRPPELQIMAPRTDGWVRPSVNLVKHLEGRSQLVVVVGDQQAPFYDKGLHAAFCGWLSNVRPVRGINLGDSVDFPDIRPGHRLDPDNTAAVNECLQSGYDMSRGYVDSSADTYWEMLYGNHCKRLSNIVLDVPKVHGLIGIKRPDTPESPGEELLTLEHAMRMDELGIHIVKSHGPYELGQIRLTDNVAVRHGWIARKGSGSSALATLEQLGYSILVGHTHRQSVVHHTKHEMSGALRTITGVEIGCMCRVAQIPDEEDGRIWPSYTVVPDWQQGFATVDIWPDGFFNIDTAKYVNNTLVWRGQRYA